ncbi:hypothetical protein J3R82DRAFT_7497 [Butyriboletus roseoflavus]|nr:hypothetical protein J3R82DRAFT_7497 [Butyriboletus roseoflavus]
MKNLARQASTSTSTQKRSMHKASRSPRTRKKAYSCSVARLADSRLLRFSGSASILNQSTHHRVQGSRRSQTTKNNWGLHKGTSLFLTVGLARQRRTYVTLSNDEPIPFHVAYRTEYRQPHKIFQVAESPFLSVYIGLAEAPNSCPLLEAAVEQTAEAARLKLSWQSGGWHVGEYEEEGGDLGGQGRGAHYDLHLCVRRTLGRDGVLIRALGWMDELVAEKVTQKENVLNATYDERVQAV